MSPLTKRHQPLSAKVSPEQRARLEALRSRFSNASRHRVLLSAIDLGLTALEVRCDALQASSKVVTR